MVEVNCIFISTRFFYTLEDYEAIFSLITHKEDVVKDSPLAKQYEGVSINHGS